MIKDKKIKSEPANTILVTGDVTIDWYFAKSRIDEEQPSRAPDEEVPVTSRLGGASLLGELIKEVINNEFWEVEYPNIKKQFIPGQHDYHHNYSIWGKSSFGENKLWKIKDFVGTQSTKSPSKELYEELKHIKPKILVIDDKGHGFRDQKPIWADCTKNEVSDFVVLRRGRPFEEKSPLWTELLKSYPSKIISVVTAYDIRYSGANVSKQLSWERTAKDLYRELKSNKKVSDLSNSTYLAVFFSPNAVVLIKNYTDSNEDKCWLIFNPQSPEKPLRVNRGEWVHGFAFCVVAGITKALANSFSENEILEDNDPEKTQDYILDGIKEGLKWAKELSQGYVKDDDELKFPFERIKEAHKKESKWVSVKVPIKDVNQGNKACEDWTILQENYSNKELEEKSFEVAKNGISELKKLVPVREFGKLILVDSREIERYQSIQRLLVEYDIKTARKPLSIAVFGPPGAGKSFGVKQVADTTELESETEFLTFNLSQFSSPDMLRGAFHQIRDVSLGRKLPIVFWDEFDCVLNGRELGWLPYFLAPMQDGSFQEEQLTHPIGPSVFVFAGGTCTCFQELLKKEKEPNYSNSKVTDFLSRLKGYVDILGINSNPPENKEQDPLYKIRRAILLHSKLKDYKVDIDEGLLKAFLGIDKYKYGARSLEAIFEMSLLDGSKRFEPSCLPPETQLEIHVDAEKFINLLSD